VSSTTRSAANFDAPTQEADQACLNAITQLVINRYDSDKPLSALTEMLIRICNGHPNAATCETASQAVFREYGKSPFTCGSNALDRVPLILPLGAATSSPKAER
jgi:hypothetical protein